MCGIAGFIGVNHIELAEKANIIQKHRGPDSQDVYSDDYISLAHQRLAIIDLDTRSNQPLKKSNYIIVFNGEIYNYKEIKKLLVTKYQSQFSTESDTEVLLEAYIQMGTNCFNLLKGMFAFSIYNITDSSLILVRDCFGIKPLYYFNEDNRFAFSSELKSLISIPEFNRKINKQALVSSLNYSWVSGNKSIFKQISKVPPGHYVKKLISGEIQIEKYWELNTEIKFKTETEAVHHLEKVFLESIDRHLIADVEVGCLFSGGLDSSLIASISKDKLGSLNTYTIGSNAKDKAIEKMPEDEKFAKKLADSKNFSHNEIVINSDIISELPKMVKTLDEPIGDVAAINTYLMCSAARESGTKVLLSGMGADEMFFGYRRQKATLYGLKYKRLPLFLRKLIRMILNQFSVKSSNGGNKLIRWSKRFISFAELNLADSYLRSYSYYSDEELNNLFIENLKPEIEKNIQEHHKIFNSNYKDPINKMCNTDIHLFMNYLNLTYVDRASMAASVEVRVPFIDKDVIETAMQIDGKHKFKKGRSKYVLKKMAEKYLPNEIIYRPKASFTAPIRSWISNELKELVDVLLSEKSVLKRNLFNYSIIKKMIDDDRAGIKDYAQNIYQLITLELWFREFVDIHEN
jgi:asparagine synthase (glutamine-hydrolysing)